MTTNETRQRPGNEELDTLVATTRTSLMRSLTPRRSPWWRRTTSIALGVAILAGGGTAAGLAITGNFPYQSGPRSGDTTIKLGAPKPTDKYVNLTFRWRCSPGAKYTLSAGRLGLFYEFCEKRDDRDKEQRSANYVYTIGRDIVLADGKLTLVMKSNLKEPYEVTASYGAQPVLPAPGVEGTKAKDLQKPFGPPPRWETNEYGLTFGYPRTDTAPEDWPDLWPVDFEGREGYFRTDDPGFEPGLQIPDPAEYAAAQAARLKAGLIKQHGRRSDYYRFVYAADGTTILGKKYVGSGSSS